MTQHITPENLVDYIYNALTPEDDAQIYTHLESCAACRASYDREAQMTEMLRAHARRHELDLPPGVVARIWDSVESAEPRTTLWERARAILRPAIVFPVAAAIALALYFGPTYWNARNAPPSIDAMYYLQDHASMTGTLPFSDSAAMPASLQNDVALTADASR